MQNTTRPLARYVHSRSAGSLVFIAGQGCRLPETDECVGLLKDAYGAVVGYSIKEQTLGVFANIDRALAAEKLSKLDLVDITVFLRNMDDFAAMNEVWNEYFGDCPAPTRTTVAVLDLPGDNYIEMKAIATRSPAN